MGFYDVLSPERLALYLVADPDQTSGDFLAAVEAAMDGGVTAVQLRVKHGGDRRAYELALDVQKRCVWRGIPFLLNDSLGVALASNADGIHIGVNDLPLIAIRTLISPTFAVGYSPETDEQTIQARSAGADYLGLGPVFVTGSKADAGAAIGLEILSRRTRLSDLPTVAIGGITLDNASAVMDSGVVGIAVMSAILRATDPRDAARRLIEVVRYARQT